MLFLIISLFISGYAFCPEYTHNVDDVFHEVSVRYGLPPKLLKALCLVEQVEGRSVITFDGKSFSYGRCQVKEVAARQVGINLKGDTLAIDQVSIEVAGKYLAYQVRRYRSYLKGIIAYNRGEWKPGVSEAYYDKVVKKYKKLGGSNGK